MSRGNGTVEIPFPVGSWLTNPRRPTLTGTILGMVVRTTSRSITVAWETGEKKVYSIENAQSLGFVPADDPNAYRERGAS